MFKQGAEYFVFLKERPQPTAFNAAPPFDQQYSKSTTQLDNDNSSTISSDYDTTAATCQHTSIIVDVSDAISIDSKRYSEGYHCDTSTTKPDTSSYHHDTSATEHETSGYPWNIGAMDCGYQHTSTKTHDANTTAFSINESKEGKRNNSSEGKNIIKKVSLSLIIYTILLSFLSIATSESNRANVVLFKPPKRIHPHICGLQNFGNTCYMNSALQCLVHTEPLRKYYFKRKTFKKCKHLKSVAIMVFNMHV